MDDYSLLYFLGLAFLPVVYYASYVRYARAIILDYMEENGFQKIEITRTALRKNAVFFEIQYMDQTGENKANSGMVYGWPLPANKIFWDNPI